MNTTFKKSILPFAISLAVGAGLFVTHIVGSNNSSFFSIPKTTALQEVKTLVSKRFMEDIAIDSLKASTIDSILLQLDPHSRYIPASDLQEEIEGMQGMFYGIGVQYLMVNDSLNVVQVLPKSPAEAAGLQVGDIIIRASDSLVSGSNKTSAQIRNILSGARGTKVPLTVSREKKFVKLVAERKEIDVNSVDASLIIAPTVGYIKLTRFTSKTYREFMQALVTLKKQPLKKLILDLRDNGGGVLEEAVEIADEFLDGDKLISYTQGFHSAKKDYRCRRLGQFEEGKLIILCNENTASASEILMGALQDWDRATIIGKRSFGKGLLQEQYNLNDGGALRLTIAKYYTPLGRSIQRSYANGKKLYYDEAILKLTDSTIKDTRQLTLTKAGKKLYDQSGITPDIILASDSAKLSVNVKQLLNDEAVGSFGYKYFVAHKASMKQFTSLELFEKDVTVTDSIWNFYVQSLTQGNTKKVQSISAEEKNILSKYLKTSVAIQLFGKIGFYKGLAIDDQVVKAAINL